MRIYVKNKLMTLRGSSVATDENGKILYYIKGKLFSITKKKRIADADNRILYRIRNKYWRVPFTPSAVLISDGQGERICKIKPDRLFGRTFIAVGCRHEITLKSDGFMKGLTVLKDGNEIGRIDFMFTVVKDAFTVEVYKEEDAAFMVALTIAVDNYRDKVSKQ